MTACALPTYDDRKESWGPLLADWDDITNIISDSAIAIGEREGQMRAYLVVQVGSNVGELFPVTGSKLILGRSRRADIQLIEDGVSRNHAQLVIEGDDVYVEDLNSRNGSMLNAEPLEPGARRKLENGDKIALAQGKIVLRFTYGDDLDEQFQRQMFDSSLRDGLTTAFNKRYFTERLESEYKFALRHSEPLSLLLLDLDHFKAINDRFGHVAGDHVLKQFAATMMKAVRNEDVFARYGGEEFAVISRAISADNANRFAERLRLRTEKLDIRWDDERIPLTVSIGVATLPDAQVDSPTELIAVADQALYAAKDGGRNQTAVYRPFEAETTKPV